MLKSVKVKMYSGEECNKLEDREEVSAELQVCAGFEGNGPCQGDSGGQCRTELGDGRWVLTGITSYSDSCGGSQPAVYTNVRAFMSWIEKIQRENK